MDKREAMAIAEKELESYRVLSYDEIASRLGTHENFERSSENGDEYRVEIEFIYDGEDGGPIRVWAEVSYSFWSDFSPVTSTFILAPNGELIDE